MAQRAKEIYKTARGQKKIAHPCSTVYFTDLDQGSEMIIYKSILTTFIVSVVFRGSWGSSKNWLKLKIEPTVNKFSLLKSVKH
jgi:hypothetical protein